MDPTMLVIDDDEEISAIVRDAAELVGFRAETVGTAACLLASMAEAMPDVIVLDLVMPDVDGMELLRKLSERGCSAKIIVMSGYQSSYLLAAKSLADGLGLATIALITKPASVGELELHFLNARRIVEEEARAHG